jgi:hypothetical protein
LRCELSRDRRSCRIGLAWPKRRPLPKAKHQERSSPHALEGRQHERLSQGADEILGSEEPANCRTRWTFTEGFRRLGLALEKADG